MLCFASLWAGIAQKGRDIRSPVGYAARREAQQLGPQHVWRGAGRAFSLSDCLSCCQQLKGIPQKYVEPRAYHSLITCLTQSWFQTVIFQFHHSSFISWHSSFPILSIRYQCGLKTALYRVVVSHCCHLFWCLDCLKFGLWSLQAGSCVHLMYSQASFLRTFWYNRISGQGHRVWSNVLVQVFPFPVCSCGIWLGSFDYTILG